MLLFESGKTCLISQSEVKHGFKLFHFSELRYLYQNVFSCRQQHRISWPNSSKNTLHLARFFEKVLNYARKDFMMSPALWEMQKKAQKVRNSAVSWHEAFAPTARSKWLPHRTWRHFKVWVSVSRVSWFRTAKVKSWGRGGGVVSPAE